MNTSKIVVPPSVASAIRHYTDLADTKSEAFTDILSMGFEGTRSEVILRHFDGNHDELMEALICGYEVEVTPEDNVQNRFKAHADMVAFYKGKSIDRFEQDQERFSSGYVTGVKDALDLLGIKIAGVNAK